MKAFKELHTHKRTSGILKLLMHNSRRHKNYVNYLIEDNNYISTSVYLPIKDTKLYLDSFIDTLIKLRLSL